MSNAVYTLCKYRAVETSAQKSVLLYMADFASDDGTGIWCSKASIALDLQVSENTVRTAISGLIGAGILVLVGARKCQNGYTDEYSICLDAVELLEWTRRNNPLLRRRPTPSMAEGVQSSDPFNDCTPPLQPLKVTPSTTEGKPLRTIKNPTTVAGAPDEQQQDSKSDFSEGFWADLLGALGVDQRNPGRWWEGEKAREHVSGWLSAGLTEDQVLAVAHKSREKHDEAPNGPKALDAAMASAASTPKASTPASPDDVLSFWAGKLRGAGYVAPSSIKVSTADELLRRGMVAIDDLRRRGIAFTLSQARTA